MRKILFYLLSSLLLLILSFTADQWQSIREMSISDRRISWEAVKEMQKPLNPLFINYDLSQALLNGGRLMLRGEIINQ